MLLLEDEWFLVQIIINTQYIRVAIRYEWLTEECRDGGQSLCDLISAGNIGWIRVTSANFKTIHQIPFAIHSIQMISADYTNDLTAPRSGLRKVYGCRHTAQCTQICRFVSPKICRPIYMLYCLNGKRSIRHMRRHP